MADMETKEANMDEDGIIELIDDDDNVVKFKLVDVTEYKGEKYAFLLPAEPNETIADDEVAVFLYKEEEQILAPIEDDELMQEVFDFWQNEDDGGDDN